MAQGEKNTMIMVMLASWFGAWWQDKREAIPAAGRGRNFLGDTWLASSLSRLSWKKKAPMDEAHPKVNH